jgi:hypothetical protein
MAAHAATAVNGNIVTALAAAGAHLLSLGVWAGPETRVHVDDLPAAETPAPGPAGLLALAQTYVPLALALLQARAHATVLTALAAAHALTASLLALYGTPPPTDSTGPASAQLQQPAPRAPDAEPACVWAIPLLAAAANRPAADLRVADTLMSASGAAVHPGADADARSRAYTCSDEFPALCDAVAAAAPAGMAPLRALGGALLASSASHAQYLCARQLATHRMRPLLDAALALTPAEDAEAAPGLLPLLQARVVAGFAPGHRDVAERVCAAVISSDACTAAARAAATRWAHGGDDEPVDATSRPRLCLGMVFAAAQAEALLCAGHAWAAEDLAAMAEYAAAELTDLDVLETAGWDRKRVGRPRGSGAKAKAAPAARSAAPRARRGRGGKRGPATPRKASKRARVVESESESGSDSDSDSSSELSSSDSD